MSKTFAVKGGKVTIHCDGKVTSFKSSRPL